MPDDKEQVTEQIQDDEGGAPPTEAEQEFSGGFGDKESVKETKEPDKKEKAEPAKKEEKPARYKGAKKDKTVEKEEKPSEKKVEPEKKAPEKEEPEPEKEIEAEEEEEQDEDELRGKELLEAEEKAKTEAEKEKEKAKEAEAEKKATDKKPTPLAKITNEFASVLMQLSNLDVLPDLVKVGDRELSIKGYAEDNPEAVILAGSIATNIVQRLIDNGVILTSEGQKTTMDEFKGNLDAQLFDMAVRSQVPNPDKIWDSKEFQEWHKGVKPEVQALFRSSDPMDHVRGFKKFMALTTKETKEKIGEHDKKLAEQKKKHDAIHGNTIRSGRPQVSKSLGEADDEFSEGFRSDEK